MRTRVGYAGGSTADPTYHAMGDHTESFQLDFDRSVVSYDELLDLFWKAHRPNRPSYGRQYMAAVICETDEQVERAHHRRARVAAQVAGDVVTPVIERARFYLAEDYHQKYHLRHHALMREVEMLSPRELVDSTLAARLNGFVAGHGTAQLVEDTIMTYALSDKSRDLLRALRGARTSEAFARP